MITERQKTVLLLKAEGLMQKDPNVDECGSYLIRSLYFDDYNNSCFYENENGTDPRSKFRIRYYNDAINHIKLEKKIKQRGMTRKKTCKITKEQCLKFMKGEIPVAED